MATGVLQTFATLVDLVRHEAGSRTNFNGDIEQSCTVTQCVGCDGFEERPR